MINWIFVPLVFFAALLCLAWYGYWGLTADKSLKVSDLMSMATTTLVAFVLQHILLKRGKTAEGEKDLLTEQISRILSDLLSLRGMNAKARDQILNTIESGAIIEMFDSIGEELSSLKFCIQNSHCKDLLFLYKPIESDFLAYKRVITGANFPAAPLTQEQLTRSSQFRLKLDKELRFLSLSIGKQ